MRNTLHIDHIQHKKINYKIKFTATNIKLNKIERISDHNLISFVCFVEQLKVKIGDEVSAFSYHLRKKDIGNFKLIFSIPLK